jgi:hypothetical protein
MVLIVPKPLIKVIGNYKGTCAPLFLPDFKKINSHKVNEQVLNTDLNTVLEPSLFNVMFDVYFILPISFIIIIYLIKINK